MARIKSRYSILIIEDESEVAEILKRYLMLYPAFHKVVIASDPLQASQKLLNQEFDLVVTDIHLGSMDAFKFIERVKAQPKHYRLKFMVVSGCLTKETTLELMRYGIRNIVVKPFTAKQILLQSISSLGIEKNPQETVNRIMGELDDYFLVDN